MKIYNYIEQTFFFTLTRKIVGNLSFVLLFQAITLFWLHQSLSEQQQSTGLFWLLTLVIISGFIFVVLSLILSTQLGILNLSNNTLQDN